MKLTSMFTPRAFFYYVLFGFSVLTIIALGKHNSYFTSNYFTLFGLLIALRCLNQKIFLFCTALLFFIAFIYLPAGLLYGSISIGIIASIYETNPNEALEYFNSLPLGIYFFAMLYVACFALTLWLNKKTAEQQNSRTAEQQNSRTAEQQNSRTAEQHIFNNRPLFASKPHKFSYFFLLILIGYSFYKPILHQFKNNEPFQLQTFLSRSGFHPIHFIADAIKQNNTYLTQRALFDKALNEKPQWQITSVEPKYQNYVMVIGESMRRDYMSLYGYPKPTTPFLEKVNGVIFDLYVAAASGTQLSLQRSLYRSEDKHETTIYTDNVISLAKAAHFQTYWLSNQPKFGDHETMASRIGSQADYRFFTSRGTYDFHNTYDTELLPELEKALQTPSNTPKLVVLHLIGSHPAFCNRVNKPREFHLINEEMSCYLDSLKQTDDLLANIQKLLQQKNQLYSVIYFSDHGLSHVGKGEKLSMLHNSEFKQNYAVPFVKFSSDDREHLVIKNPQSGFNFIDGFAQWLGIRENHLSQQDFFNPPANQPIKVFNWHKLVDYQDLKDDPAKVDMHTK